MGRVKLVGVGLRRFFPRSAPSIHIYIIYILIYLFKLSYIFISQKAKNGSELGQRSAKWILLGFTDLFSFSIFSGAELKKIFLSWKLYTYLKTNTEAFALQKIIPTRDPKRCCKELEEEIWGYHVRFCKFLCGDLCRRSCARSPWQVLCGSCCARSLCKAICTRCL